jgi:hypothetical protein
VQLEDGVAGYVMARGVGQAQRPVEATTAGGGGSSGPALAAPTAR